MAFYIPRWYTRPKTVTHPSTNQAQRALTLFKQRTPLTTTPRCQLILKSIMCSCISYLPLIPTSSFMGGHVMQLHVWTENSTGRILLCVCVDGKYLHDRNDLRTSVHMYSSVQPVDNKRLFITKYNAHSAFLNIHPSTASMI